MQIGKVAAPAIAMMNKSGPMLQQASKSTKQSVQVIKKAEKVEDLQTVLDNFLVTKKQVIASLETQEKALRDAVKAAQKATSK